MQGPLAAACGVALRTAETGLCGPLRPRYASHLRAWSFARIYLAHSFASLFSEVHRRNRRGFRLVIGDSDDITLCVEYVPIRVGRTDTSADADDTVAVRTQRQKAAT